MSKCGRVFVTKSVTIITMSNTKNKTGITYGVKKITINHLTFDLQ